MLDEMGKTALVIAFVQTARRNFHPDKRGALGRGIAAHHIAHAVIQLTETVALFRLQIAFLKRPFGHISGSRAIGLGSERCVEKAKTGERAEDG